MPLDYSFMQTRLRFAVVLIVLLRSNILQPTLEHAGWIGGKGKSIFFVRSWDSGKYGVNPSQSRCCNRGRTPHEVTVQ